MGLLDLLSNILKDPSDEITPKGDAPGFGSQTAATNEKATLN